MEPRPPSDFVLTPLRGRHEPRDLALMLGVASFVDLDFPHLQSRAGDPPLKTSYLSAREDWTSPQVVDTGQTGKPVLLMTRGLLFPTRLLPFLYPHFSRIVLAHNQDGFWRQDLIDRFKPDIVILEVLEGGLRVAMGDGPALSAAAIARIDHVLGTEPPAGADGPAMPALAPPAAGALAIIAVAAPTPNCNLEVATLTPGVGR